jgi:acyl-CoA thioester hydrolase
MGEYQFTLDVRVGSDAEDELGHVNNATYLQYIEQVARGHAESLGLDTEGFLENGGVFVVRKHEVEYFAPAHSGDALTLKTRVEKISGPRCTRLVDIWRGEKLMVHASTDWVWVDADSRAPKRIPPLIAEAFAPIA